MPLDPPELDSRRLKELLEQAIARVRRSCEGWSDFTAGDPGVTLLEAYAFLTEQMIARLNRLPELAYLEFLRLLGLKLRPPAAAEVELVFSVTRPGDRARDIPEGTRVCPEAGGDEELPIFTTVTPTRIEPGGQEVKVRALHCEWIEGEKLGTSNGQPGQSFKLLRLPVIARTGFGDDLLIGVAVPAREVGERVHTIRVENQDFRIWREVDHFSGDEEDRHIFVADRFLGRITFAPALQAEADLSANTHGVLTALGEVPPPGAEIRAWYRRGGGAYGNVAANTLTRLRDVMAGIDVTNPERATGGRDAETLSHALRRGPQEFYSLERAVTASDYELLALRSGGVARAKAVTETNLWRHATPGKVDVLLVPQLPGEEKQRASLEQLHAAELDSDMRLIDQTLNERKPLGTFCQVHWVKYKQVKVKAKFAVYPGVNVQTVEQTARERLNGLINPLPNPYSPNGWAFGELLHISAVYDILLADPGVRRLVGEPVLSVENVPDANVLALEIDHNQPRTWYAASGRRLFRTLNDAAGWELTQEFDFTVTAIRAHPSRPGLVAVLAGAEGEEAGTQVHVTRDCGETWKKVADMDFLVHEMAWTPGGGPESERLYLATARGLYQLTLGATPVQLELDKDDPDLGVCAVTASASFQGNIGVAVAALRRRGIFYSPDAGKPGSFFELGLKDEFIRELEIQQDGGRNYLWAAITVAGNEEGKGAVRWDVTGNENPSPSRQDYYKGWRGGSCRTLAFSGASVFAGTHTYGVLRLDSRAGEAAWERADIGCGLPLRDDRRLFLPIRSIAATPSSRDFLLLVGTDNGVFRSAEAQIYEPASRREFSTQVTLPPTWLFCSGEHELQPVSDA